MPSDLPGLNSRSTSYSSNDLSELYDNESGSTSPTSPIPNILAASSSSLAASIMTAVSDPGEISARSVGFRNNSLSPLQKLYLWAGFIVEKINTEILQDLEEKFGVNNLSEVYLSVTQGLSSTELEELIDSGLQDAETINYMSSLMKEWATNNPDKLKRLLRERVYDGYVVVYLATSTATPEKLHSYIPLLDTVIKTAPNVFYGIMTNKYPDGSTMVHSILKEPETALLFFPLFREAFRMDPALFKECMITRNNDDITPIQNAMHVPAFIADFLPFLREVANEDSGEFRDQVYNLIDNPYNNMSARGGEERNSE